METTLTITRNGKTLTETLATLELADAFARGLRAKGGFVTRIDYTIEGERFGSWIKGSYGWRYYTGMVR